MLFFSGSVSPTNVCHKRNQRSRSVENAFRRNRTEIEKISERLYSFGLHKSKSGHGESIRSTPTSTMTSPMNESPIKKLYHRSAGSMPRGPKQAAAAVDNEVDLTGTPPKSIKQKDATIFEPSVKTSTSADKIKSSHSEDVKNTRSPNPKMSASVDRITGTSSKELKSSSSSPRIGQESGEKSSPKKETASAASTKSSPLKVCSLC